METAEVFEEWSSYAITKSLLPRDINLEAMVENSGRKIIAITGIRRSGKSSILMLLAQKLTKGGKKVGYVNLEDSRLNGDADILDDILKWFGEDGFLLLDEVSNAKDWQGWLSRVHELLKGRLRIIISSSRSNIALPSKPLRGRVLVYEVFPLSFSEFLSFKGIKIARTVAGRGRLEKAFEEYHKYGGFPEVVLTANSVDKLKIINSYFKDIVGLDVAEISGQDIGTVDLFGRYVLQTSYFSASKCLNFLKSLGYKIGKEKILELEKYAETSYLFFFVSIFSRKIKDRAQYPRKAYPGDTGLYYGTSAKTDLGRSYESIVFLELKRRQKADHQISYWKNRAGLETDFVIMKGASAHEAIQVAYDVKAEETNDREMRGLLGCCKELKPVSALIITKDATKTSHHENTRIRYVAIIDWLLSAPNNKA